MSAVQRGASAYSIRSPPPQSKNCSTWAWPCLAHSITQPPMRPLRALSHGHARAPVGAFSRTPLDVCTPCHHGKGRILSPQHKQMHTCCMCSTARRWMGSSLSRSLACGAIPRRTGRPLNPARGICTYKEVSKSKLNIWKQASLGVSGRSCLTKT